MNGMSQEQAMQAQKIMQVRNDVTTDNDIHHKITQ